jgi:hypothetical protein
MALTNPSASPAVTVREIDLSGTVPNVQTSTGAVVGNFRWGPIEQRTLVSNETSLVSTFGSPSEETAVDFMSAAYFLKYSSSLYAVRAHVGAKNASTDPEMVSLPDGSPSDVVDTSKQPLVKNSDHWETSVKGTFTEEGETPTSRGSFIAKYAGALGSALTVSVCSTNDFDNWGYSQYFDGAPGTSGWASDRNATNDELHIVVVDRTGEIAGTPNGVLETFSFVSVAKGALTDEGAKNYIGDVLDNQSPYVWFAGFMADATWSLNAGRVPPVDGSVYDYVQSFTTATLPMSGGKDSSALSTSSVTNAFDLFLNAETVVVDFLIAPKSETLELADTVISHLVGIAEQRKDCVVVASPHAAAMTDITPVGKIVELANALPSSSYLVMDNNFVKIFDKYNNKYIKIPACSSTAGVMAASDISSAPWFSPAGSRRGIYLGITDIVLNPSKSDRDTLYKVGVNPIANIPGQGVILFGDKTFLKRPSAFDRINVRRLFLALERAITVAGKNVMFEFNDEFTRAEFVNIVEPLLREVQGRRGITDFKVVCDETNNTSAVVDRNEFVASIFIKPARSINYVTLNFVAVRTGVEFEEVVGTV